MNKEEEVFNNNVQLFLFGKDSVVERFVLLSHLYVVVVLANVVDAFLLKLRYAFGVECQ